MAGDKDLAIGIVNSAVRNIRIEKSAGAAGRDAGHALRAQGALIAMGMSVEGQAHPVLGQERKQAVAGFAYGALQGGAIGTIRTMRSRTPCRVVIDENDEAFLRGGQHHCEPAITIGVHRPVLQTVDANEAAAPDHGGPIAFAPGGGKKPIEDGAAFLVIADHPQMRGAAEKFWQEAEVFAVPQRIITPIAGQIS